MLPLLLLSALVVAPAPDQAATALVDTAIVRMGGQPALARIVRVRMEMMTQ